MARTGGHSTLSGMLTWCFFPQKKSSICSPNCGIKIGKIYMMTGDFTRYTLNPWPKLGQHKVDRI